MRCTGAGDQGPGTGAGDQGASLAQALSLRRNFQTISRMLLLDGGKSDLRLEPRAPC